VGQLIASVKAGLADLAAEAERTTVETGEATDESIRAFEHTAERVEQIERELDGRLQAAEAELAAFREAIAGAGPRFEEATNGFLEAITRLHDEAVEQTRATVDGATTLVETAAEIHNRLSQEIVDAANTARADVQRVFTETVPGQLPSAYEPLRGAFVELDEEGDAAEKSLRERADQTAKTQELEGAAPGIPDSTLHQAAAACAQ
jgi:hypothetical protein